MENIEELIEDFAEKIGSGDVEIYNEFSLQHELGCYLREKMQGRKIQFERNISYFNPRREKFIKKEIDISVFTCEENRFRLEVAIELKFPRNGQMPVQIYEFIKDIKFAEELRQAGFENTFAVIFVDDSNFWKGKPEGIYGYFRDQQTIEGSIKKPLAKNDEQIDLKGKYKVEWQGVNDKLKYAIIKAQKTTN